MGFACKDDNTDEPGRMRDAHNGKGQYQSACEFKQMCAKRAKQGYNSGMGMVFRKVAGIGKYKDMCMDGEEPKVESKESEESESEEPKVSVRVSSGAHASRTITACGTRF